jgi:uncharacterized protein involved in type VI secretion and phage assembly
LWIKVDGTDLPPAELSQVVDVTIEQDLVLPDALAIRIRDKADQTGQQEQVFCKQLDEDRFPVGGTIEVGLGREAQAQRVIKGEITSLELDAKADGAPVITVRAYDGAHRLHRERKSRTFVNAFDRDIVTQIAREYGLTPRSDATTGDPAHVFQDNQTDWQFLRERAARVGYELFVDDGKLYFRKPAPSSGQPPELEFGKTLHRLRLRLSAPAQVDEVVVKGWDSQSKREIVGRASRPTTRARIGERRSGGEVAQRLGAGKSVLTNQPVHTQAEADALAQSALDEIAGDFIQLEGVCLGEPNLRAGKPITLKNLGRRFDGTYYLSATTHRVTPDEGYMTHLTVSGRRPVTLSALLAGAGGASGTNGKANGRAGGGHPGVLVGLVTNNKDAERGGRVKVRFPWLGDDESTWARLATPMAGDGRGFYFLPEVGDEVLVACEQGDINFPYVVGALWNGREKPPEPADEVVGPTGKVDKRIIRSRLGHTITLDDSDSEPNITIVDKTGQNTIKLDSQTNALSVNVQGNVSIEAVGDVSLKGKSVSVEATTQMSLKGATVNIN